MLLVDHSATPGGGQFALLWMLQNVQSFTAEVLFLADGPLVDAFRATGAAVTVVNPGREFTASMLITSAPALAKAIHSSSADAVVATSAAAAKALALVPIGDRPAFVYLQEDLHRIRGRGLVSAVLLRLVYPMFDGFLANSAWTASTIPREYSGVPALVALPPSHIDSSAPDRSRRFAQDGELTIATFSRPERWKGLDLLVNALRLVQVARPDARFRLDMYGGGAVSDPGYERELARTVSSAPSPAVVHGHIDDMSSRMLQTDVLVLPSRLPEPFGQVVAQGLSHGCVVVVSDRGGAIEQIEPSVNGLTFEMGSVRSLADRLIQLIDSPELSVALTERARETSETLTDRSLTVKFELALSTLITSTRVPQVRRRRLLRRLRSITRPIAPSETELTDPHKAIVG